MSRLLVTFLIGLTLFSSAYAQTGSDPTIKNTVVSDATPGPNDTVDVTVFFQNVGSAVAEDVAVSINYNENHLGNVVLGDPSNCFDSEKVVFCEYEELTAGKTMSVGFSAKVFPDVERGTEIFTSSRIEASENVNTENDEGEVTMIVGGVTAGTSLPIEIALSETATLDEPSQNQGIALFDVAGAENWRTDTLNTIGLKFMIRGKEALAWALGIDDAGFENPAIRDSYLRVLTVINSVFILGLLAIALMWMFSLLIPRQYLRQVVIVYGLAVIFVNFAFPLNQLLIDGANLLQRTFLGDVDITQIAQTPNYNDPTAVSYLDNSQFQDQTVKQTVRFPAEEELPDEVTGAVVGNFSQGFAEPIITGTITGFDTDGNAVTNTVELNSLGKPTALQLNANQPIELVSAKTFNPNQEHSIFTFAMTALTGLAYFGMALIFILRIVILWGLLIVSPALLLLAVFHSTRSVFYHWLSLYARWLMIGPLLALGIALVVGIWKVTGLPITSTYSGVQPFGIFSNIGFYLPGSNTINNFGTTGQMMEYLLFLAMLYLPILFSVMLTRSSLWSGAASVVVEQREARATVAAPVTTVTNTEKEIEKTEVRRETGGVKSFLNDQVSKLTSTALPGSLSSAKTGGARPIEAATSFLPQHLAVTPMKKLMELSGGASGSRVARKHAIEQLANPAVIPDRQKREQMTAIRSEIEKRAEGGDAEATRVLTEIHTVEKTVETNAVSGPAIAEPMHAAAPPSPAVEVTVKSEGGAGEKTDTAKLPDMIRDTVHEEFEKEREAQAELVESELDEEDDSEGAIGRSRLQNESDNPNELDD